MDHNDMQKQAERADRQDPLRKYREEFLFTGDPVIYLDGNSLGRLAKRTQDSVANAVEYQWGERLIRSWNEDWYNRSTGMGDKIGQIAGASAGEVVVTDNTSSNLYKLAYAALKSKPERRRIITDNLNFPSDLYILQGLVKQFGEGYELEIVPSTDGISVTPEAIADALDDNTALVSLSHVAFKSAYMYPMEQVTRLVHDKGALVLWDLSHSIGAVPGQLNASGADLAVGCTYKYLNGGPGSPAFLYVRKDLQDKLESPVWGWFGEKDPFGFSMRYRPGEGIRRFLSGTPPLVSMIAMEPTLDMLAEAGMDAVRKKSMAQSEFLFDMAEKYLYPLGFKPGSPADSNLRGSHVTFRHPEAYRICKALIDPGIAGVSVIPDFRAPDNIRLGITPLYTTFEELYHAVMQIRQIVEEKLFVKFSEEREQVT